MHAVMSIQNPAFAPFAQWIGQDYSVTDMQGRNGVVSFDGDLLVATFFDQDSEAQSVPNTWRIRSQPFLPWDASFPSLSGGEKAGTQAGDC